MARVGLVGLGEVGRVFAEDLRMADHEIVAWDRAFGDPSSRASGNARDLALRAWGPETITGAELVVSAVTPSECTAAARAAAPYLAGEAWYFDLNSSSPAHKQEAASIVEAADGRYVEAALMSAITPRRLASPFLLGGPHASAFASVAAGYGLGDVTVVPGALGTAAATKLCRSVIVKGMEALFAEGLLAARHHGVEEPVLASLGNALPDGDWGRLAAYFLERSLRHGIRRAEEMEEAAGTVAEAGVEPLMSRACADRQAWAGGLALSASDTALAPLLDAVLAAAGPANPEEPR